MKNNTNLIVIMGEYSHGKSTSSRKIIEDGIIDRSNSVVYIDSRQEDKVNPNDAFQKIINRVKTKNKKNIEVKNIMFTLRVEGTKKMNYSCIPYLERFADGQFNKVMIVHLKENKEKREERSAVMQNDYDFKVREARNIIKNSKKSYFKEFDYVEEKDFESKIQAVADFVSECLKEDI